MVSIRPIDILSDRSYISEIWQACFTDDLPYINSFIDNCLPYTTSWLLLYNNRPASLLTLIPSYTTIDNSNIRTNLSGVYIYGVATLPQYRGNSYSKLLIEQAISYSQELGLDYVIVKPAEESLYSLYSRVGFKTRLYSKSRNIVLSDSSYLNTNLSKLKANISFHSILPEELFAKRQSLCKTFLWPEDILKYALSEILLRPDVIAQTNGEIYFIAYPACKKRIIVLESNAETITEISTIASVLQRCFPSIESISIADNSGNVQEKSALLKVLHSDQSVEQILSGYHLPLAME